MQCIDVVSVIPLLSLYVLLVVLHVCTCMSLCVRVVSFSMMANKQHLIVTNLVFSGLIFHLLIIDFGPSIICQPFLAQLMISP